MASMYISTVSLSQSLYYSITILLYQYITVSLSLYITVIHTCHILPPSEIYLGLCLADFTDLEGKHLFHTTG